MEEQLKTSPWNTNVLMGKLESRQSTWEFMWSKGEVFPEMEAKYSKLWASSC